MQLTDVHSVLLDKTKPFDMVIQLKDETGHLLETIKVTQLNADHMLNLITKKWLDACWQEGQPRKGKLQNEE